MFLITFEITGKRDIGMLLQNCVLLLFIDLDYFGNFKFVWDDTCC